MKVKIAKTYDIQPGQGCKITSQGRDLALFNCNGTYYVVADACSHLGAPLWSGNLEDTSVTCQWHGATFDLKTGAARCGPTATAIRAYPVFIDGEDIEVELEES